jgi:hypothetical protein
LLSLGELFVPVVSIPNTDKLADPAAPSTLFLLFSVERSKFFSGHFPKLMKPGLQHRHFNVTIIFQIDVIVVIQQIAIFTTNDVSPAGSQVEPSVIFD